ncbi:PilZ domain-containing protein [bacterium]|nr:PilZ domain-containing protein [bacterium]
MKYRQRRKPTDFPVVLLTTTGEQNCEISDVSEHGASLRHEDIEITAGELVSVKLRGREFGARVVWSHADEVGLAFTRPLPKDVYGLLARERH